MAESGEANSKVLLALIYRLALIERQVSQLGLRIDDSGTIMGKIPQGVGGPAWTASPGDKSGLLEQIFRKNLLLRREK